VLIPLGTERALRRPTLITLVIIALCVAIHLGLEILSRVAPDAAQSILTNARLYQPGRRPWTLITSAFLHGGLLHLLGNMLFLWAFGPNVEDRLGRPGFLALYLGGAAASGALHAWIDQVPAIGASGAVAAVTGTFLVLFPFTNIKAFVIFFVIGLVRIPALYLLGGQIAWELLMRGVLGTADQIARMAHLGGYAFGIAVAIALLWSKRIPREPHDLFTIGRQAARRREFQELKYQQQHAIDQARRGEAEGPLVRAREAVTRAADGGDWSEAVMAYRTLLGEHGRHASLFGKRLLGDLGNQAFQSGDHTTAATAYELVIEHYASDPDTPTARLMLGLINARYLNDPTKAKREIQAALPDLHQPEHLTLARSLLDDLG
jgi:membrane associated rhomboid family serine protease